MDLGLRVRGLGFGAGSGQGLLLGHHEKDVALDASGNITVLQTDMKPPNMQQSRSV